MKSHFASADAPGARLVVAIAPAFTIGLVRPSPLRSTAASELKGKPVAFAPSFWRACSGPTAWQTAANTNAFDTLMMENSYSVSPTAWISPLVPATQMPNRSLGTSANAGYTCELLPSLFDLQRS